MKSQQQYLKVAIAAAKDSGKIFKKYFGHPQHIKTKNGNPRDLVTDVDLAIEKQFRELINKKYPGHLVLGEEFGAPKTIANNKLIWIIDPIDGTTNFTQGVPLCCISIALWDKNGPLVGVVYNPITNNLFSASKNRGAFKNGKRIHTSSVPAANKTYGAVGWGRRFLLEKKLCRFLLKI